MNIVANVTDMVSDIGYDARSSAINVGKILYDGIYTGCFIGNNAYDGKK